MKILIDISQLHPMALKRGVGFYTRNLYQALKTLKDSNQYYLKREVPAFFLFFDQRIIIAINSRFHNFRTTFRENDRFYMRMAPLENWFVPKILQRYSPEK